MTERQALLERLGWKFLRIRGSQFYKDPDGTMNWGFEELKRNGLEVQGYLDSSDEARLQSSNELVEEIKRRAAEIRS